MSLVIRQYRFIIFITAVIIMAGCSSSSYSGRYGEKAEKGTEPPAKQHRFSSEDDPNPSETKSSTTYSDPANSSEFDETPVEDHPVDKEAFVKNYKYLKSISSSLTNREKILFEIVNYLETPYQYGGNNLNGIDCSAFTQNIFNTSVGISLPRTASEQYNVGHSVSKTGLQFGDLVFFNTNRHSYPGHVGIFIGNDKFVHASSSLGVTISSLKSTYFEDRYIGAKRVEGIQGN